MVAYVNSTSQQSFTSSSVTNVPAGTQEGDLLVLFAASNWYTGHTPTQPGWTELGTNFQSLIQHFVGVWYRWASASEPASYGMTWDGASQQRSLTLHTFRDVDVVGDLVITHTTLTNSVLFGSVDVEADGVVFLAGSTTTSGTRSIGSPAPDATTQNHTRLAITAYDGFTSAGSSPTYTLQHSVGDSSTALAACAVALNPSTADVPDPFTMAQAALLKHHRVGPFTAGENLYTVLVNHADRSAVGVFESDDDGATWTNIGDNIRAGSDCVAVNAYMAGSTLHVVHQEATNDRVVYSQFDTGTGSWVSTGTIIDSSVSATIDPPSRAAALVAADGANVVAAYSTINTLGDGAQLANSTNSGAFWDERAEYDVVTPGALIIGQAGTTHVLVVDPAGSISAQTWNSYGAGTGDTLAAVDSSAAPGQRHAGQPLRFTDNGDIHAAVPYVGDDDKAKLVSWQSSFSSVPSTSYTVIGGLSTNDVAVAAGTPQIALLRNTNGVWFLVYVDTSGDARWVAGHNGIWGTDMASPVAGVAHMSAHLADTTTVGVLVGDGTTAGVTYETFTVTEPTDHEVAIDDTAALIDNHDHTLDTIVGHADTVTVADSLTADLVLGGQDVELGVTEHAGIDDDVTTTLHVAVGLDDPVGLVDDVDSAAGAVAAVPVDTAGVVDDVTASMTRTRNVLDTVAAVDTVEKVRALSVSVSDSVGAVDDVDSEGGTPPKLDVNTLVGPTRVMERAAHAVTRGQAQADVSSTRGDGKTAGATRDHTEVGATQQERT